MKFCVKQADGEFVVSSTHGDFLMPSGSVNSKCCVCVFNPNPIKSTPKVNTPKEVRNHIRRVGNSSRLTKVDIPHVVKHFFVPF